MLLCYKSSSSLYHCTCPLLARLMSFCLSLWVTCSCFSDPERKDKWRYMNRKGTVGFTQPLSNDPGENFSNLIFTSQGSARDDIQPGELALPTWKLCGSDVRTGPEAGSGAQAPLLCAFLFPEAPTRSPPCSLFFCPFYFFFLITLSWSGFHLMYLKRLPAAGEEASEVNPCILVPEERPRLRDPPRTLTEALNVLWSQPPPSKCLLRPQGLPGITTHEHAVCPLINYEEAKISNCPCSLLKLFVRWEKKLLCQKEQVSTVSSFPMCNRRRICDILHVIYQRQHEKKLYLPNYQYWSQSLSILYTI